MNEDVIYLLQFHKWKLKKDSTFLTYFFWHYLNSPQEKYKNVEKQHNDGNNFFYAFYPFFFSTNTDE